MKCINKYSKYGICLAVLVLSLSGCSKPNTAVTDYENTIYNANLFQGNLFAENLCISTENVGLSNYTMDASLSSAGLFDLENSTVLYAQDIHKQIYPASTTKILTAYIVLKYGNLSDIVTVSESATQFEPDAQICGLQVGDQITLEDLLIGLVLYSGNDNAVAIAEHMSGSVEAFAELMNTEAQNLGATKTHFTNPHGLHEDDHYTTAYDLYLMFDKCLKDQRFIDIIAKPSYTATIQNSISGTRTSTWIPTNYYTSGIVAQPTNVTVIGGKTGTTNEAGTSVVLLEQDVNNRMYISIVMGAPDKTILYNEMTALITALPAN